MTIRVAINGYGRIGRTLLRALYEWCTDNGYTPYIVVSVDAGCRVPMEFVKNGEIVLNISFEATGNLKMDNDLIHFKARFGGVAREIEIPVDNVSAIYARENGQGMAFEVKHDEVEAPRKKKAKVEEAPVAEEAAVAEEIEAAVEAEATESPAAVEEVAVEEVVAETAEAPAVEDAPAADETAAEDEAK